MPTRYLKPGIRDSGHIEALADHPDAELLYYRLIVTVDDFGRFDGRKELVKAYCFPTRLRATADKCIHWLKLLSDVGLIILYDVENKPYLQITKWDNKPRAIASKYPAPPVGVYTCPQMLPVTVTVTETKTVTETEKHTVGKKINGAETKAILQFLNDTAGKRFRQSSTNLDFIRCRLEDGISEDQLRKIIVRKSREWLPDPKMRNFLRPATLFNKTQCEQYLGELVPPNEEKHEL